MVFIFSHNCLLEKIYGIYKKDNEFWVGYRNKEQKQVIFLYIIKNNWQLKLQK